MYRFFLVRPRIGRDFFLRTLDAALDSTTILLPGGKNLVCPLGSNPKTSDFPANFLPKISKRCIFAMRKISKRCKNDGWKISKKCESSHHETKNISATA